MDRSCRWREIPFWLPHLAQGRSYFVQVRRLILFIFRLLLVNFEIYCDVFQKKKKNPFNCPLLQHELINTNIVTRLANKLKPGSVPQVGTQKAPFIQMVRLQYYFALIRAHIKFDRKILAASWRQWALMDCLLLISSCKFWSTFALNSNEV